MDEVALGRCPWCGEQVLNSREERPRESLERICIRYSRFDKPSQGNCFLRGDTHSLAEGRIESADNIAQRQQMIRKMVKRLKASANAARKSESVNRADGYGVLDRVIDRRSPQRPGKSDEIAEIIRHRFTMHGSEIDLPAIVLDWNKQPAATALGGWPV